MSRSFKHTPITKDISRMNKRQANRIVRQRLKDADYEIGNNASYKSIVDSWDLFDYKCYRPNDLKAIRK